MSSFRPTRLTIPPPPPPPPPPVPDMARSAAMADEALASERRLRKGRGSTIVAGALQDDKRATRGTPTLLG